MFNADDHRYMSRALRLAEKGLYTTDPNPRVGCVIVNNNQIVGEGWHLSAGQPHAEINALAAAGGRAKGGTVYVTLEPCSHHGKTPPCVDALIQAGIKKLICAQQDPNPQVDGQGMAKLRTAGIAAQSGLMSAEAEVLNPGFFSRMLRNRPYLRVKMAMSMDGRTALANGLSQWISSPAARLDVQRWRARSSAIMTGINTVLKDDPSLTLRLDPLLESGEIGSEQIDFVNHPQRIVLDSFLRIPLNSRLLHQPGNTLIVCTVDDPAKQEALNSERIRVVKLAEKSSGKPSLLDLMKVLSTAEVNEVLVEGGHILAGALLSSQLVDELILYVAPAILGDSAKGLFKLPILETMQAKTELDIQDVRTVGPDLRIIAKPKYTEAA